MDWFINLFTEHTDIQAVMVLAAIVAIGLGLGKIKFFGISLGVTFVFFAGILAGHLGLTVDPSMLKYAESFGLILFVYELGLQVGPGFFSAFRKGGMKLNLWGLMLMLIGTFMTIGLSYAFTIPMDEMVGVLCGATTNTPALGAAQQALQQLGLSGSSAALSCAITYPLGVVGVILALLFVRKLFVKSGDIVAGDADGTDETYIATFKIHNPAIFGKSIREIALPGYPKFVISRLWRQGNVTIPTSEKVLEADDRILVITTEKDLPCLTILFGEQEQKNWNKKDIDWNAIDHQLISRYILITRPDINGKKLGSLRLRNEYGINISRIMRSGVKLLATPDLVLQLGDRLTVVGEASNISRVEKLLGNAIKDLNEPNIAAIFIGILLGLILGSVPIWLPGMTTPVRLGLAGGPIIVGILVGSFGPRFHMVTYTTPSANLMLRGLGISMYLACLGLDAGKNFFDIVMQPTGAVWIGLGFLITFVPVTLLAWMAMRIGKMDFGTTCGMLCGSMANPMALNYVNDTIPGDNPSVSYATVYPLTMFCRVIIAQILIMLFM